MRVTQSALGRAAGACSAAQRAYKAQGPSHTRTLLNVGQVLLPHEERLHQGALRKFECCKRGRGDGSAAARRQHPGGACMPALQGRELLARPLPAPSLACTPDRTIDSSRVSGPPSPLAPRPMAERAAKRPAMPWAVKKPARAR